ncbi:phage tail terminator protein [Roseomonas xinghualingensis]|uniref:phage tail terminator protein n=1 Tax=Roseomonas xinghualingensis TaxID=2986475 RepID=UPI0021F1B9ED|nr:hypothetical protein [Roseomonas sp. SXEYE001]MCV4209989.1 hypothetical protein [Roseomonas sp. SXEYE001]
MIRPSLVIPRIKAQCPIFANRVAGAAAMRKALLQDDFPVPHAFVVPLSDTGEGEVSLSDLAQELPARFGVVVVVDNTSDEPGMAAAEKLMNVRDELHAALIGWAPSEAHAPCIYVGMPDDPDTSRARCWAQFDFTSTAYAATAA